jgi:hypothetical protein
MCQGTRGRSSLHNRVTAARHLHGDEGTRHVSGGIGAIRVLISVLLVDPDSTTTATFARLLSADAAVRVCADFHAARQHLFASPPDLLVTHFRLREHNGLHLVYLAAALNLPTRSVVYTDIDDPWTRRAIQGAGGFYETRVRLTVALPAYVSRRLPLSDRREFEYYDRRGAFRGGRRATDRGLAT